MTEPNKRNKDKSSANRNRKKLLKKERKQRALITELEKSKELEEITKSSTHSTTNNSNHSSSNTKLATSINNGNDNSSNTDKLPSTISIAVPGSILDNAQSSELRTYLAGQIARAACIFRVDEVIVFDDTRESRNNSSNFVSRGCSQLARILQYLECPQYLRKHLFPLHEDLKYCGLLNPLDAPHHLRQENNFLYREGVVTDKRVKNNVGSYVNVGLFKDVLVDKQIASGLRVTVQMDNSEKHSNKRKKGIIVSPNEPRLKTGLYWGYSVRIAENLSDVLTNCPYEEGYDLTIGTSDKGSKINDIENTSLNYNHAIIVFGGLNGIEKALENDEKLMSYNPEFLFDYYVNVVPNQGSRTIRTEEAILISLSIFQDKLNPQNKDIEFDLNSVDIPHSEDTGRKFCGTKNGFNDDMSRFD